MPEIRGVTHLLLQLSDLWSEDSVTQITRTHDPRGDRTPIETAQLGFTLSFVAGKGLLTTRDLKLGPFDIKVLELEIPHIKFPFDVTGGAEKFKTRRCELKHLTVALSGEVIAELIQSIDATAHGFHELKTAMRDGHIEITGRLQGGEHAADFTMRAALLPRALDELAIVFYDTRVYGVLPIPSALIPTMLRRALDVPFLAATGGGDRASTWLVKPAEQFVRNIMPQLGWKVPDTSKVAIAEAQLSRGQLVVAIGPQGEPSQKQLHDHAPPAEAALVHEGASLFDEAELLLSEGQLLESYEIYRAALDDERGGKFVRDRLLQIGSVMPDLALETKQLADEILGVNPHDVQALLALGTMAMRERAFGEAAGRFDKLSEQSREGKDRFDAVAAELASAAAAAPIDREAAIAAYERAASRARDSVVAHRALFELRAASGEWDKAAKAGDRLTRLERDPKRRAAIYKQLGHLARSHLNDLKKARIYFERALKLGADDPESLEGLAETYAARGEPARAASYLARLAEQAEQSGDLNRIVTLNLRLGEIWEKWLGDTESAAARYLRVLDAKPRDRLARLRLAELAERTGDVSKARLMLEEIVALEDEATDPTLVREIALAYTRLARIVIHGEGMTGEAIASLERAVELDPNLREARDQLATVLRERGEWQKLVDLLAAAARVTDDSGEAKRARLDAARIELQKRNDPAAAQHFLETILDDTPDDAETLDLLLPILREQNDFAGIMERVTHAAEATPEPVRRAEYLLDLARARDALGMDPESRRRALEDALDANPYLLEAAEMLVQLLEDYDDYERLVKALGRIAVATSSPDVRADALLRQGRLLWQQLKRPQDAEQALREAVRLEPGNFATWTALSRLLESIGKMDEAREVMAQSLLEAERRSVGRGPLHERLAELARAREDWEEEARELLLAVEAGVRGQKISDRLVAVLSHLGRIKEAATLLEDWAGEAELPPRDSEMFLFKAAELRRSLGEAERASVLYRGLLDRRGEAALPSARALEKIAESRGDWDTVATTLAHQLEVEKGDQLAALLTRMCNAQARREDWTSLESYAEKLVALDDRSVPGRWHLSQCLLRVENFHEALFNLQMLVLEGARDAQYAAMRKDAYVLAAALALEIDASQLPELHKAFADELPEEPPTALTTPFGSMLAHGGEWVRLLALRRAQLERADESRATSLRREIATILHERLSRSDAAIPFYQDVIASEPDDMRSRDALVEVFEKLGRWGDLANTLFALSQVVGDSAQAMAYGLRGVRIYADKLHDRATGAQVLRTLVGLTGLDPDNEELVALLRELELHAELAHVLSMSLEKAPSPDDGRLGELVEMIEGPLAQADTALDWGQRYVSLFPEADEPRGLVADLLLRHEDLGDLRAWLERWAKDREGPQRAPVLGRLAEYLRGKGNDSDALTVLEAAAEYDPRNLDLLQRLVDRTTGAGNWSRAAHWLERLVLAVDDIATRDMHLRRLVQVASDFADEPTVAIRALLALAERTAGEEQHLAELWVETGDVIGIRKAIALVRELSTAQLLTAARHLAGADDRETARELIDVAIARGDDGEAWALADVLWDSPAARIELANWRLAAAARESRANVAAALRIEAYTALIAAHEQVDDDDVRAAFDGADFGDPRIAWGAFQLSRAIQDRTWEARAAAALDELLPKDDERLPDVVNARARIALAAGDAAEAVTHARKLVELGDARGERLLDEALEKSGDTDSLVAVLTARAEGKPEHEAASIWTRIARIELERQDSAAALIALERVHDDERDLAWGRLMYDIATGLADVPRRAESARTIARFTSDEEQRADWLRTTARLAWWELGDEARGRDALKEAQLASPESPRTALERASASIRDGDTGQARRDLLEGLAVHAGEETVLLWLRLADVEETDGNRAEATRALEEATRVAPDDGELLVSIGERAERVAATDLALAALAKAMRLDGAYEGIYLAALMRTQNWAKAVVVLQGRAEELGGKEAARRYVAAADIALDQLDDAPRALAFLELAAQLDESETSLRKALRLAEKLERHASVVDLAERLDALVGESAEDALAIARKRVTALDTLGRESATAELRQRLVDGGHGTANDHLVLARLLEADAPDRAARHLRSAALELADRPELLVQAAALLQQTGDSEEARPLVSEALERGIDTIETHQLAAELLTGETRLRSLARLIEAEADTRWDDARRASIRLELAQWHVGKQALEEARLALIDAARFGKPKAWVQTLEAVLQQQNNELDLAALWLEEAPGDAAEWTELERNARVQRAASIYHEAGDDAGEYRALELLSRFSPDDDALRERLMEVVAKLGDVDDFVRRVEHQLAAAMTPGARAEVVMRYAGVLDERFGRGARAIELTLAAFDDAPSLELARLLRKLMTRNDRVKELAKVLHRRAMALPAPDDRPLLQMAAEIAAEVDRALAYEVTRELHTRYPDDETARDFVIGYAADHAKYGELVPILRISAAAAPDAEQAFDYLLRAADIARDHLRDEDLEVQLIDMALGAMPGNAIVTQRLFDLRVKRIELDQALATLKGEGWAAADEMRSGVKLVQALRGAGSAEEADALAQWLAERHPDTSFAGDVRLAKARAQGDRAAVLQEIEARLATVHDFHGKEWLSLHAEAGEAASALGDPRTALEHFIRAIDTPEPSPDALRRAHQLATQLGDEHQVVFVIQSAANAREQLLTRATSARGAERHDWLYLLGQAHESANDTEPAIVAYRQAVMSGEGPVHARAFAALEHLFRKRGEWQEVADLHDIRAKRADDASDKADSLYRKALIWKEYLFDEDGAEGALEAALTQDPEHPGAQLELGMLAYGRRKYARALPLLRKQLDERGDDAAIEHWMALLESLKETGDTAGALTAAGRILDREPMRNDVRVIRAELLEKSDAQDQAAEEWRRYLESIGNDADADMLSSVHEKLARHALRHLDRREAMSHYEAAYQLAPESLAVIRGMRALHEAEGSFADAAALRTRELALATDAKEQLEQHLALAKTYSENLSDPARAAKHLEKAHELEPGNFAIARELFAVYDDAGQGTKLTLVGERLVSTAPDGMLDAAFYGRLAQAYEDDVGDAERAKVLVAKAVELAPHSRELRDSYIRLALATGDYATWAPLEERLIEELPDVTERARRYQALADIVGRELKTPAKAASLMLKARELDPNDATMTRRLADTYALDPASYAQAADLYATLLDADPLNVDLLKILARLSGQIGDTDRAYGYYAALLVLSPNDAEGKRFVVACRNAMPPGPQRAITDADRQHGLIHPEQLGTVEELFAPLARFAELTHPGNLRLRGVDERDQLAPTDERVKWLTRVLEPLGLPQVALYLWRGGGFACEAELVATPSILLGSTLASDASQRQRAFLVARAAELYRSGHTLCERLPPMGLEALAAALCMALIPGATPPGAGPSSAAWATTIGAPMTEQIRAALRERAKTYMNRYGDLDLGKWRRACLATAARVAMLLSCDVEDAIAALLRLRGFDDIADDQRAAVLLESPEALDLLRFALSPSYFKLREALGMALRRAK